MSVGANYGVETVWSLPDLQFLLPGDTGLAPVHATAGHSWVLARPSLTQSDPPAGLVPTEAEELPADLRQNFHYELGIEVLQDMEQNLRRKVVQPPLLLWLRDVHILHTIESIFQT